jgi:ubiquinone/menaquinone biosynthesis C-methylase UbiE
VSDRVVFQLGDAHRLDFGDDQFDVVIGHTLLSHVRDPVAVLREMARAVRPEGTVAIFDGDYASLTYAHPDREFGRRMDAALAAATFNNPFVVRDLARLLPEVGLKVAEVLADVVSEIGHGSYFRTFAETYVPFVIKGALIAPEEAEAWLTAQQQAIADGAFFASCNYYTFLVRRA